MSVRRFPTLDSWGSALDVAAAGGAAKPPPGAVQRCDSLAAMAAQRFTHNFAAEQETAAEGGAGGGAAAQRPGAGPMPPLVGRGLRKRQHSSRRTLMAALSRDNSVASSMDGMQPSGKARHVMDPDSAGPSPDRCRPAPGDQPSLPLRPLHRSSSLLGREAAAAAAMAEAAAKALAAALPADMLSPAGTPTARQQAPPFCACGADDYYGSNEGRPPSPLHARMVSAGGSRPSQQLCPRALRLPESCCMGHAGDCVLVWHQHC